jgi:uncharacterized protein involved in exopolysaccharide biosynthesis
MAKRSISLEMKRFWRVPVVAVLAGVLGFGTSFLFATKYVAKTQLLIRAHDTTYLSNSGETLGSQNAIFDSQLTQALSETQSALLNSNQIAATVVSQLHLDAPKKGDHSFVGSLKNGLKSAVKHLTAWIVHGGYKNTDRHTQAIDDVQSGLSSHQVDTSYVLELDASATTAQDAQNIANAAADELVRVGEQRFEADATANQAHLSEELTKAATAQQVTADNLGAFVTTNGVASADVASALNPETKSQLQTQLAQNDVALSAAIASQAALARAIAAVPKTCQSQNSVVTGRSTTDQNLTQPCDSYQQLLIQKATSDATVASDQATHDRLSAILTPGSTQNNLDPAKQSQLQSLEARYTAASASFTDLKTNYQQSIVNGAGDPVAISRVDRPALPTYPASPKRYLFLGMGIVAGAVLGLLLSALASWRKGENLFPEPIGTRGFDDDEDEDEAYDEVINLNPPGFQRPTRMPAPVGEVVTDLTSDPPAQRSRIGKFELFEQEPSNHDTDVTPRTAREG